MNRFEWSISRLAIWIQCGVPRI